MAILGLVQSRDHPRETVAVLDMCGDPEMTQLTEGRTHTDMGDRRAGTPPATTSDRLMPPGIPSLPSTTWFRISAHYPTIRKHHHYCMSIIS